MLLKANIRPYSNIIVAETCQGLVTGAVLERVGANGNVVQIHPGDVPMMTTVDNYDFCPEIKASLRTYPLYGLQLLHDAIDADTAAAAAATAGGGGAAATATSSSDGATDAAMQQLDAASATTDAGGAVSGGAVTAAGGSGDGGAGGADAQGPEGAVAAAAAAAAEPAAAAAAAAAEPAAAEPIDPAKAKVMEERKKRREAKRAQWKGSFELLRASNMDALIIAVKYVGRKSPLATKNQ